MKFFLDVFTNPFLTNAILAGILASIASGIMGSYVVIKKISSLSGSISHSILGGIGICIYLQYIFKISWLDPIYGAFVFAFISAFFIGWVHLKASQKEDAIIAAIWSAGMAIGVIFMSFVPSYGSDFLHFLFGNIMLVSKTNLYTLFFLNLFIIAMVSWYYKKFLVICFDEELAFLQKINVKKLYLILLSLISISIVLLIQVVGIILVIAFLTIPATISIIFTKKFYLVMIFSCLLCVIFSFIGIFISYEMNIPTGASIAIVATLAYLIAIIKNKL